MKWHEAALLELKQKLPIQNPLHAFVHNNILLNMEQMPFDQALSEMSRLYRSASEPIYIPWHQLERSLEVPVQREFQDFIIPLISTFLDQGSAIYLNPWKESGWIHFLHDYVHNSFSIHHRILENLKSIPLNPHDPKWWDDLRKIIELPENQAQPFLVELAFYLKGWSGMIHVLQSNPEIAPFRFPKIELKEWIASLFWIWSAYFNLLNNSKKKQVVEAYKIEKNSLNKFQFSFYENENKYLENQIKPVIRSIEEKLKRSPDSNFPKIQIFCCIDDREESLRRHIEQNSPEIETFGVVAFFGIDMRFHRTGALKPTLQCPPVIQPRFDVYESGSSKKLNQWLKKIKYQGFYQTRTALRGAFFSFLYGGLSFFPLVFRIVLPKLTHQIESKLQQWFGSPHPKELNYSSIPLATQAEMILGILAGINIENRFAPLVILLSHGSTNQNNPFRQAYGCGACSGNSGFPNAIAFQNMANDPEVRQHLRQHHNFKIPDSTVFIGSYHDTTADTIVLHSGGSRSSYWTDLHDQYLQKLKYKLFDACQKNALERIQSFKDISTPRDPKTAAQRVQTRSIDIAQPRPEYGHSGVSLAIIGPRYLTKELNLNRESFLISYDSFADPDGSILSHISAGAIPVCANIALDYFYSSMDCRNFGAGSKLPLNIVSLLGVMTGSKSDLRVGLAQQMVENHLPKRITILVIAYEKAFTKMLSDQPRIKRLHEHQWIHLIRIDPKTEVLSC